MEVWSTHSQNHRHSSQPHPASSTSIHSPWFPPLAHLTFFSFTLKPQLSVIFLHAFSHPASHSVTSRYGPQASSTSTITCLHRQQFSIHRSSCLCEDFQYALPQEGDRTTELNKSSWILGWDWEPSSNHLFLSSS